MRSGLLQPPRPCGSRSAVATLVATIVVAVWSGCKDAAPPAAPKPPEVPVRVGKTVARAMPIAIETVGTVEAYNSVRILPRVSGQVLRLHFTEGQDVVQDDLLVSIDPAPFEERLREAQARLTRDQAALQFKKAEAQRHAFLVEKGAIARSDYERYRTDAEVQDEIIRADEAAAEQARLDLSYCTIRAPISGRTGAYRLREGAIVVANQSELLVINQIKPIYVRFSVPEKHLAEVKRHQRAGPLAVTAQPPEHAASAPRGQLTFFDNTVDTATGMIQMKAEFKNEDAFLWPGQFVQVSLILRMQPNAVVAPAAAVQLGQKGAYVFVVGSDQTAQLRLVKVERTYAEEAVLSAGVKPGETVVVDGQNRLKDGFKVRLADVPGAGK